MFYDKSPMKANSNYYSKTIYLQITWNLMEKVKTNTELLLLLKEGNMVAFDAIYEKYSRRLYRFVIRYVKLETDAEEIVQDVFIKIWENRQKINAYSSFESYLFTVSYNSAISLLRKRIHEKKYLDHLKYLQHEDIVSELTDELYFKELNSKIQSMLAKLTPRQKEIFLLSREEGLTHDEIAKKLGISVNTVKNHIVSVLNFLKSNIDNSVIVNVLFVYLFLS
jgi:RNA polymerase sigma-70 factor (ECF subfamily)